MEEMYVSTENDKSVHSRSSTNQTGPSSSERRFYRAVVLCLGLLSVFLLIGLIGLSVHYRDSVRDAAAELSNIKANMTNRLQDNKNKLSSLTAEKDQLNTRLIEITKNRDRLDSLSKKTCLAGWTMFSCSCYLLSNRSDSWTKGREDCRNRGADLVVINSAEEQTFLSGLTEEAAWIGLTDRDEEGTWTWVDGTPLTFQYWDVGEPNDGVGYSTGREDCGEIRVQKVHKWNDKPCELSLRWICEKEV